MKVLEQNLKIARNFKPMSESERDKLLAQVKPVAGDGRHEQRCADEHEAPTTNLWTRERLPAQGRPRSFRQLAAGRVALLRGLRQGGSKNAVEGVRELGPDIGESGRRFVEVGEDDRELALAVERPRSRQTLVEDAAERVDVGSAVDRSALDLLGRDVVDRADEASLPGQAADRRDMPG